MQPHSTLTCTVIYTLSYMWVVVRVGPERVVGAAVHCCLQAGVCYPGGIVATWSANFPLFVPSLPLPFLLSPLSYLPLLPVSHPVTLSSSLLISIPLTTSSLILPALSIHSDKRTNEALKNDEGVLSFDHNVIQCTSDLGNSLILGSSAYQWYILTQPPWVD